MPPGAAPAETTAKYIVQNEVGIRVGEESKGACYALIDVSGSGDKRANMMQEAVAQQKWAGDPGAAAFHPKWVNRLWNCCQIMHTLSKGKGTVHFLSHVQPTAERYHVEGGVGDGYTFAKFNKGTESLHAAHTIDMTGHDVQWLYDEVFAELLRQSG